MAESKPHKDDTMRSAEPFTSYDGYDDYENGDSDQFFEDEEYDKEEDVPVWLRVK